MLRLFRNQKVQEAIKNKPPREGYLAPLSAELLLNTKLRQQLIQLIWQRTSLSAQHFQQLYLVPFHRFAALVQLLPASESHHHAYAGGMIDHGLEIIAYALKMRQSYLLPSGAAPEDQSAESEAWTAGLAYAALLHDIGKIAVDQQVQLASGSTWHPWNGPIGEPYRIRFVKGRDYKQHPAAGGLLTLQVLTPEILDWLSGYPTLFAALNFIISGHYESAGMLGELVIKADQASVSKALGGNPSKAIEAPKESLQAKLIHGLRHLVKNDLRLNQPGAAGWLTADALWLVSKPVTDQLKALLLSQGFEGVPQRNSRLFDELQSHGIIQPNAENMAIWSCLVTDPEKNWSQKLTMFKVAPALIWGTEERPNSFAGSVIPQLVQDKTQGEALGDGKTGAIDPSTSVVGTGELHQPIEHPYMQLDIPDPNDDELAVLMSSLDSERYFNTETSNRIDPCLFEPATIETESAHPIAVGETQAWQYLASNGGLGQGFVLWLKKGLKERVILMNEARAKVHTVAGTVFLVTPGVFQRFAMEHPKLFQTSNHTEAWKETQKQFQKLKLHQKNEEGLNIWRCQVNGPKKTRTLQGYLLKSQEPLFDSQIDDNPFLILEQEIKI